MVYSIFVTNNIGFELGQTVLYPDWLMKSCNSSSLMSADDQVEKLKIVTIKHTPTI